MEYFPNTFKKIRQASALPADFLFNSFSPANNYQAVHNFFTGTGRSESFFFFTDNKELVLKTLKESEKVLLLKDNFIERYWKHFEKNPKTLLPRIYGVYEF